MDAKKRAEGHIIDSATILPREGFEALLVFAALIAFLRKAGQSDKGKYLLAAQGVLLAAAVVALVWSWKNKQAQN
ncbi:high-affinity iron transporter [Carboxydocella sporoproducens DSM 16521]|uniref:High-affinity iron transporter n=2 Tax=Carboxydocella TaxID=178898 RepID=A0A1T4S949_9FIRM|nr:MULTISPECIES: hypothetical protein [Carboxydocella]AVX20122.1 hypothetical protein CFE_0924 [Carboxydocella thermautotrophica]AVX30541.1 hypothetical protein CTH_0941 [Carboxydocella thermautotrophica]SKA24722.1 high-affinity iron transporter [Carboxydocella sporoproducens DSM 16521]